MDKQNEVLLNTFVISKRKYRVFYNAGVLVWEAESSKKGKITVPLTDIISVAISATASGRPRGNKHEHSTTYGTTSSTHAPMNEDMDFDRIPVLPSSASISTNATINTMTTSTNISNQVNSYDFLNNEDNVIGGSGTSSLNYLIIHYARLVSPSKCKWRVQQLVLHNVEQRIVKFWHNRLSEDIGERNRPKSLLLFLNPYGGKQKAFALFEKYAKPLFQLAQVDVNLIITQRAQQIYDIMTSQAINLNNYDGVVCCGGDGTFAELFNGLIYRTMIDMGMDINRPPFLPKPGIPIGIIPAGSTDTVAYCLNGTTDIKTSIIHIILGQSYGLDISSVYNSNDRSPTASESSGNFDESIPKGNESPKIDSKRPRLLKMYASVLSYGFLGDVTMESEKYRWMGPKRYDYAGFKKFLRNRGYQADIKIQVEKDIIDNVRVERNNPHDGLRCLDNCQRCQQAGSKAMAPNNPIDDCDTEELTISGKFLMVNGANISCSCYRSPQGFNPYCHLGDGYLDLILVRHTSFFNNIRLLLAMSSKTKKISDLPFVEIYRTKKFTFNATVPGSSGAGNTSRQKFATDAQGHGHDNAAVINDELLNRTTSTISASSTPNSSRLSTTPGHRSGQQLLSKWNCDGEILMGTNVTVECNCQLINVFRRGISCADNSSKLADSSVLSCCGLC
ncbi:ceramide kinase [Uranotaenia lowii]|uniref:ceramide kinase n=1 Tax=Uranotaenia lowii TaxID=190385 RepID=UPI00247AF947|nr:ceramide kinase [Uranotaenia lowii]